MSDYPLISCVMPTANRPKFAAHAIGQFLAQGYPNKELVILSDTIEDTGKRIDDSRLRYYIATPGQTLGMRRNVVNYLASGEYIIHWDDDDWFASDRIGYQYREMRAAGAAVSGLRAMLFYDLVKGDRWLYEYGLPGKWLAGGSLMYRREVWESNLFKDVHIGSDWDFTRPAVFDGAVVLQNINCYVATIHPGNTSVRRTDHKFFKPWGGAMPQGVVDMAGLI